MKHLSMGVFILGMVLVLGCETKGASADLDSTCFPYDIAYEWTYVRHSTGYTNWGETLEENWDRVDTFMVRVVDSTWKDDTLIFHLRGKGCEGYPGQIFDVGNPVKIWSGKVQLHLPGGLRPGLRRPVLQRDRGQLQLRGGLRPRLRRRLLHRGHRRRGLPRGLRVLWRRGLHGVGGQLQLPAGLRRELRR